MSECVGASVRAYVTVCVRACVHSCVFVLLRQFPYVRARVCACLRVCW